MTMVRRPERPLTGVINSFYLLSRRGLYLADRWNFDASDVDVITRHYVVGELLSIIFFSNSIYLVLVKLGFVIRLASCEYHYSLATKPLTSTARSTSTRTRRSDRNIIKTKCPSSVIASLGNGRAELDRLFFIFDVRDDPNQIFIERKISSIWRGNFGKT